MRIVCPACTATYEVREALLVPGRAVRCARCGEQWVPLSVDPPENAEAEDAPSAAPLEPAPASPLPRLTAMERLASHPAPVRRTISVLQAAWAASLAFVLLFFLAVIVWRADLMQAWPPSTRLYDAIGLAPGTPPH